MATTTDDLVSVHDAVRIVADHLGISQADAAALLIVSGLPTVRVDERVRVARGDVTAYARHLAWQAKHVPVRGGPDIGHEAELAYRAEQDDDL